MDSSGQVKWTWSREKSCQIKWNQIKSIQVKAVKSPGLTRAIRPAPTPISGLAATMTSVSFHPFTKPMQKPHTNVVKRCRNMATWSAMASLILLMSLQHRRDRFNTHTHRNSRNTFIAETASSRCHSLWHASVELPYGGAVKPADLHPHHSAEVHFSDELDLPGSGRHPQGDLSVRKKSRLQSDCFRVVVAGYKSKQGSRGTAVGVLYGICRMKQFDPRHFYQCLDMILCNL